MMQYMKRALFSVTTAATNTVGITTSRSTSVIHQSRSCCFVASNFFVPKETTTPSFSTTPTFVRLNQNPKQRFMSSSSTSGSHILESMKKKEPSTKFEGVNVQMAMEALAKADAVCFDVDSTVITEEGIDVLADFLKKGEEVKEWTKKAMDGNTKFEDALEQRLNILEPSLENIQACLSEHELVLTDGMEQFISTLQSKNIAVFLISGGFRIMIEPIAQKLNIDFERNVYANTILFNKDGTYNGFDSTELTSADMGKPKAIGKILQDNPKFETIIMVGDGATDAQTKPPATAFIGYGGVAVRDCVKEKACWYVHDFTAMNDIIQQYHTG